MGEFFEFCAESAGYICHPYMEPWFVSLPSTNVSSCILLLESPLLNPFLTLA